MLTKYDSERTLDNNVLIELNIEITEDCTRNKQLTLNVYLQMHKVVRRKHILAFEYDTVDWSNDNSNLQFETFGNSMWIFGSLKIL